jgi:hypothetical protein
VISHIYKCIFIHQRKCAGTSIIRSFGLTSQHSEWHTFNDGTKSDGLNSWSEVKATYLDYLVFSVVRNPWERFVSGWKYCPQTRHREIIDVLRNLPKEGHGYRHVTRLQSEILYDNSGEPAFHVLLRFEALQEEWDRLCLRIGKPVTQLPHLNATEHRPYKEYFNKEAKRLFEQHFAADIERFGYCF